MHTEDTYLSTQLIPCCKTSLNECCALKTPSCWDLQLMGTFCRWSFPSAKCVHSVHLKSNHFRGRKHPLRREQQQIIQPKLEGGEIHAPSCKTCCFHAAS